MSWNPRPKWHDITHKDNESNISNYEPINGATFYALDTERFWVGDGTDWIQQDTWGPNPEFDSTDTGELSVGGGATLSDLLGSNLSQTNGELEATDTDTQLSDSEVQTAINNDGDHGSTASHNYIPDTNLSDSEVVTAVENEASKINADVDQIDGYDIQKDGSGGSGIINFKTSN